MSTLTRVGYPETLQEHARQLLNQLPPVTPPLRLDSNNVLRVGPTRIPLERVIYCFNQGQSPEAIVDSFDTLALADVYAVIACYLRHREAVDAYVAAREKHADELEREHRALYPQEGLRERLLARRQAQR